MSIAIIFFPQIGDVEVSTPKRRASTSPMPSSSPDEDIKPKIKQEHMDTTGSPEDQKKSRTEVADAESNTMHSGKSQFYHHYLEAGFSRTRQYVLEPRVH